MRSVLLLAWPALVFPSLVLAGPPPAAPRIDAGAPEGFRLEPRPAFDTVFGDVDAYRKTVDRFTAVADLMQQRQGDFTRSVQAVLARLQPPPGSKQRPHGCPDADVALPYAQALRLGGDYLRAGRELTRHFEQIRDLDRLGETVGLTPDYRWKVKHVLGQYQSLLVDYKEMKVAFHDQLADELRYAGCNLDKLLARADAAALKEEGWPAPGQPGAPGVAGREETAARLLAPVAAVDKPALAANDAGVHATPATATREPLPEAPQQERSGIFIYIDNSTCSVGTHVSLDGKPVADVPPATRAALQTTPGPHDLCLLSDGSPKRCGEPGTARRTYMHEGWTISLRCN